MRENSKTLLRYSACWGIVKKSQTIVWLQEDTISQHTWKRELTFSSHLH
jgi:hypothetical protein